MARERSKQKMGYFRTPDVVTDAIANMLELQSQSGVYSLLDPCAGNGRALARVYNSLARRNPRARLAPFGIELDRDRSRKCDKIFRQVNGRCVFGAIEDCKPGTPSAGASLVWFNPPYDQLRGGVRMETELFRNVADWTAKPAGVMVLIVPDYVLADRDSGLAQQVDAAYESVFRARFPEPEYDVFKQCVTILKRREKSRKADMTRLPTWAADAKAWPELKSAICNLKSEISLPRSAMKQIRRTQLSELVLRTALERSRLHGAFLNEAAADDGDYEQPVLPLRQGHLALALAASACDGLIETDDGCFVLRGTTVPYQKQLSEEFSVTPAGNGKHEITVLNQREFIVRALCEDGTIVTFSSEEEMEGNNEIRGAA